MNDKLCLAIDALAGELRMCCAAEGHEGPHAFSGGSELAAELGPMLALCRDENETTLDELLEWLNDLITFARADGFAMFAAHLAKCAVVVASKKSVYEPTAAERAAARRDLKAFVFRR